MEEIVQSMDGRIYSKTYGCFESMMLLMKKRIDEFEYGYDVVSGII